MRTKKIEVDRIISHCIVQEQIDYRGSLIKKDIFCKSDVYRYDLDKISEIEEKYLWGSNYDNVRLVDTDLFVYKHSNISNPIFFNDQKAYSFNKFSGPLYSSCLYDKTPSSMGSYVYVVTDLNEYIILDLMGVPCVYVNIYTYRNLLNKLTYTYIVGPSFTGGLYNEIINSIKGLDNQPALNIRKNITLSSFFLGRNSVIDVELQRKELAKLTKEDGILINATVDHILSSKVNIMEGKDTFGYMVQVPGGKSKEPFYLTNFLLRPTSMEVDINGRSEFIYDMLFADYSIVGNVKIPSDAWISIDKFKKAIFNFSSSAQVNSNGSGNMQVILEQLRNLIYRNSLNKILSIRRVPKMGYYLDYGTSIYPDWTSTSVAGDRIYKSLDTSDKPIFDVFRVENSEAPYPMLANTNSIEPDEKFYDDMEHIFRSFGFDPENGHHSVVGPLLFGWALGSFYLPYIMRDYGKYPQFNIYGSAKAGKTFASTILNNCFGVPSIRLSPTTTSVAGFTRLLNSYTNGFAVLDEFTRKSMPSEKVYDAFVSVLRSNYDGSSRVLGSKSDATSYTKIQTGIPSLLLGESMIEDNALRSRAIVMQMDRGGDKKDAEYSDFIIRASYNMQPTMKWFIENISESEWFVWKERINVLRGYMKANIRTLDSREIDVWSIICAFSHYYFRGVKNYHKFLASISRIAEQNTEETKGEDVHTVIDNFVMYVTSDLHKNNLFGECMKLIEGKGNYEVGLNPRQVYNLALLYEKTFNIKNITISSANTFSILLRDKPYFRGIKNVRGYDGKQQKMYIIDMGSLSYATGMDIIKLHFRHKDSNVYDYTDREGMELAFRKQRARYQGKDVPVDEDTPIDDIDTSFLDEVDEDVEDVGVVEGRIDEKEAYEEGLIKVEYKKPEDEVKPRRKRSARANRNDVDSIVNDVFSSLIS